MRLLGERRETVGKSIRILHPRTEPALEVVIAERTCADVPARIDDKQLDAHGGRASHLVGQHVLVDHRSVGEPCVVGDEWLERTSAADAVHDELMQGARLVAG